MISGAPEQARWLRGQPRRSLAPGLAARFVCSAFAGARILSATPLADGMRNANFKLHLDGGPGRMVLRIYEHDVSLCQKELDLLRTLADRVPVPEVIHAEPCGIDDLPPFLLMSYIEGITFRELRRTDHSDATAEAAYSVGETLAAIGQIRFRKSGWIEPGPSVGPPLLEGADPVPRFVDLCLASPNVQRRLPEQMRNQVHTLLWAHTTEFKELDHDPRLCHGDFNRRNILVRQIADKWAVVAVLDWEFAVAGHPLGDMANFLRYDKVSHPVVEPHFSAGYLHAGGTLPHNWRRLAQLTDLAALCESLTYADLPDDVSAEIAELISATVEERDFRI
jgi:aminoglycoside phosphotransferase (APT) family kinase protein